MINEREKFELATDFPQRMIFFNGWLRQTDNRMARDPYPFIRLVSAEGPSSVPQLPPHPLQRGADGG
jgi:hypothetical protein